MKQIRLREDVALLFGEDHCEFHGSHGLKLVDLTIAQLGFLKDFWENGFDAHKVNDLTPSDQALLKILRKKDLLRVFEPDYTRDEIWLSHHVADSRQSLRSLADKEVMFIGCGGTGAVIADHLARAGIKKFILVDGAKLDGPDLNRQFPFRRQDIGAFKAEALARILSQEFEAKARAEIRFLQSETDFSELKECHPDLIICCADQPVHQIESLCLDFASRKDTPILFGAVGISDDQIGPLVITQKDRQNERQRLAARSGSKALVRTIRGSVCWTNTIAAAQIGFLAYRFLVGLHQPSQ